MKDILEVVIKNLVDNAEAVSITEKSEVYFEPIYQAIIKCNLFPDKVIYNESLTARTDKQEATGYVKCLTHTYLRGTNFENKVVIIDEAQNYYFDELKKVLTRMHDSCKVIVIGHSRQCDLFHNPERSGFVKYLNHFAKDDRCAVCKLTTNYRGWLSNMADELE